MNSYSRVRVGCRGGDRVCRGRAAPPAGAPSGRRLAAAMGSPGAEPRHVPALQSMWDAPVDRPRSRPLAERHRRRVPGAARITLAAEVAPPLAARGKRVFDLSGRVPAARRRAPAALVSADRRAADVPVVYGLTERNRDRAARRDARRLRRAAIRPRRCSRCSRCCRRPARAGAIIIDAKSGVSGAGKTPTERTHFQRVPRQPLGLRRVRSPARGRDRAGARRAGHLRAAPGAARSRHPRNDLRASEAGRRRAGDRRGAARGLRRRRRSCG